VADSGNRRIQVFAPVSIFDLNGDGYTNILWHHQVTGEVAAWCMNGPPFLFPQGIATIPDLNWKIVGP
jgi:hypothetical protein